MVLYEANFIKLQQLIRNLHDCSGTHLSYSENDCDLHLTVEDRTKYTCQLRLTYVFEEEQHDCVADPDLLAKVYFDARMVEVKDWVNGHRHTLLCRLGRRYSRPLDLCWTRNIMLSKWLDYLLENGHRFPATAS